MERKGNWTVTLDAASHRGVLLKDRHGHYLPYCARYNDGQNRYQNFLSLRFDQMAAETLWLFCPKSHEARFLAYFLSFQTRPRMIFVLLQHHELDNLFPILKNNACQHYRIENRNYLYRSVKNRTARQLYPFQGVIHVFFLEKQSA